MARDRSFQFNLNEAFEHLPHAPIVEAVIHWRARAVKDWNRDDLKPELVKRTDYPECHDQRQVLFQAGVGVTPVQTDTWHGWRLTTADKRYVAQFSRDGLVFSRLHPYEDWARFAAEGLRLWRIFVDVTEPLEIQRLGVRFINRIKLRNASDVSRYLKWPPKCLQPLGLPMDGFLHQSTHQVPGHPFCINVSQTIQPAKSPQDDGIGLILDIDVYSTRQFDCDDETLNGYLEKMRWLKNTAFFSLLKAKAIESFR